MAFLAVYGVRCHGIEMFSSGAVFGGHSGHSDTSSGGFTVPRFPSRFRFGKIWHLLPPAIDIVRVICRSKGWQFPCCDLERNSSRS